MGVGPSKLLKSDTATSIGCGDILCKKEMLIHNSLFKNAKCYFGSLGPLGIKI
jgi:hypothetical protein